MGAGGGQEDCAPCQSSTNIAHAVGGCIVRVRMLFVPRV